MGTDLQQACGEPFFLQLCSVTSVRCTLGMSTMMSDFSWHEPTSGRSSNQTWQFAFWLKAWPCREDGRESIVLEVAELLAMHTRDVAVSSAFTTTSLLKNEGVYMSLYLVAIELRAYVYFST